MTSSTHFSTTALRVKHAVAVKSNCTYLSLPNELFFYRSRSISVLSNFCSYSQSATKCNVQLRKRNV